MSCSSVCFTASTSEAGSRREAGTTLEMRVKKVGNRARAPCAGRSFADLVWNPVVLVEMKRRGEDLVKHCRQAFDYWTRLVPGRPRYVVLSNVDEFWVYDFETQMDTPVDRLALTELPQRWGPLAFLFPTDEKPVFGNDQEAVTRQAADRLAVCFNKLSACCLKIRWTRMSSVPGSTRSHSRHA